MLWQKQIMTLTIGHSLSLSPSSPSLPPPFFPVTASFLSVGYTDEDLLKYKLCIISCLGLEIEYWSGVPLPSPLEIEAHLFGLGSL